MSGKILRQAQQAKAAGNSARAQELLLPLAEQGNPQAQYQLGQVLTVNAWDVPRAAKRWFREAAAQGHAASLNRLGELSYSAEAVALFRRAAARGDVVACYNLGECYRLGKGVAVDYRRAVRWFRKAGAQGHIHARMRLALMYQRGLGVARNDTEAFHWFKLAANARNWVAQIELSTMYEEGRGVTPNLIQAYKWLEIADLLTKRKYKAEMARPKRSLHSKMLARDIEHACRLAAKWVAGKR